MSKKRHKGYYVNGVFVAAGSAADQQLRDTLHDPDTPSRSAKKRASRRLQLLGEALVTAPKGVLAGLQLPEELNVALSEAQHITSFGARRRQLQWIGKLMRRLDDETVKAIHVALKWDSDEKRNAARQ